MTGGPVVVMYAEDPGAANFVGALVAPLAAAGAVPRLFADGLGARQLRANGIAFAPGEDADGALTGASVLVVGVSENRGTRAHRLVDEARRRRVPSFGAIDGPSQAAAHMFAGEADEPMAHAPDCLLVPDAIARRAFVSAGFPDGQLFEVEHPHLSRVMEAGRALTASGRDAIRQRCFPGLAYDRPIVVFLAELSDGLDPAAFRRNADYTLAGWGDDDRRTHVVLQEVLDAIDRLQARPQTVLRLHPKNDAAEFARYADRVDRVSQDEPALEVVFAADAVVGLSTVLLAEAAVLGRPVLSVLPRQSERAWLPSRLEPSLACVTDRAGLHRALAGLLSGNAPPAVPSVPSASSAAARILRALGRQHREALPC